MACMWSLASVLPANDAIQYAIIADDLLKRVATLRPWLHYFTRDSITQSQPSNAFLKYSRSEILKVASPGD